MGTYTPTKSGSLPDQGRDKTSNPIDRPSVRNTPAPGPVTPMTNPAGQPANSPQPTDRMGSHSAGHINSVGERHGF